MKPFWKWIIGVFVTLLLVLSVGVWYLGNHWRPLLNEKLHELVLSSSDSLYRVEYDDMDFNLVTGHAYLNHFKLIPDTAVYHRLKQQQKAPDNLYAVTVSRLEIKNFHPKNIYTQRKLNIDQITIQNPDIQVINENQPYNDTIATKDKKTLYQKIDKVLNELTVDHIAFENVNVTYSNRNEQLEKTTRLKNVNINVTNLRVDSASQYDSLRFYNAKAVDLQMNDYRIATGDSLYYIDLKGIHFTSADRSLVLEGLKMTPRYNKIDFYKQTKIAKDRFELSFDTIGIHRIDLFKLLRQQKLYAGNVTLGQSKVEIYNNKAYPSITEKKIGKYPHQQLRKLAFPLKIDTLLLHNLLVTYTEHNGKTGQTGIVSFHDTKGTFYNLTNDSLALMNNQFLTADLQSKFMNNGKLHIHFSFDMLDKLGGFTYSGTLTGMNAKALNPLTKPLAMIQVSSGYFSRLAFRVKADEYKATGHVQFYYKHLAVQVILKDKNGAKAKNPMVSLLTNKFLINDSNPDANERFHPGPINYRRPLTASFFNFLWKSLFEGVKASVGIDKEREAKLMNTAEEADKTVGKVKGFFKGIFKKKDKKEPKAESQN
ncbi:hypothetical protein GCM10023231_37690 [Olivibacter ginsenosidimutans]|uniref:DUF748 domain-containing protein n=1 Tax=Olivibacter ginsenosidimutans TaxID=1176537 RepID=A0ABP9C7I2_9SPHI